MPKLKINTSKQSDFIAKDKNKYKIIKSKLPDPGTYNPKYGF